MDDLDEHILELSAIPEGLPRGVRKIVSKGSFNIKKDWRDRWRGHPHIARLPFDITYDVTARVASVVGEIGPVRGKGQGSLGHLIELGDTEYGSVRNAPIPGGLPALAAEEPRFVQALANLCEKAPVGDGMG
jgi:hypothetical protein